MENESGRPELLKLMSSWWDFSEEDRIRVGLGPRVAAGGGGAAPFSEPGGTLLHAFESFLMEGEG